jgi:hypothetical protein
VLSLAILCVPEAAAPQHFDVRDDELTPGLSHVHGHCQLCADVSQVHPAAAGAQQLLPIPANVPSQERMFPADGDPGI